mmetsp:Transcript_12804/g.39347  ORF Transcript_12804/g.39347 Transcript_12804/m.39347 type:complete len:927 (+) Transcript_12804:159-2939(+)
MEVVGGWRRPRGKGWTAFNRRTVVLLIGLVLVAGYVRSEGVMEPEDDDSVVQQILSEVPSSGRFDDGQKKRLKVLFEEFAKRTSRGEEKLPALTAVAKYVIEHRKALRKSFPRYFVGDNFVVPPEETPESPVSFGGSDAYHFDIATIDEDLWTDVDEKDDQEVTNKTNRGGEATKADLFNMFTDRDAKKMSALASVKIEFLKRLPKGDVRVLLNDKPLQGGRFLSERIMELYIPTEALRDDKMYMASFVEVLVDDETVSWIPLRLLIKSRSRQQMLTRHDRLVQSGAISVDEEEDDTSEIQSDEVMDELELMVLDAAAKIDASKYKEAVAVLREAGSRGHSGAVATLALMHLSGAGSYVKQNLEEGAKLLKRANGMGDPEAQAMSAMLLHTGLIPSKFPRDKARELLYLNFAAKAGSPYALAALAYKNMFGIDVKENCHAAAHFYELAATSVLNNPNEIDFRAQYVDSRIPYLDDSMNYMSWKDHVEYFKLERRRADLGVVESQLNVASVLLHGAENIPQDARTAKKFFELAIKSGSAHAKARLGYMYYRGAEGVPQNNATAFRLFEEAAQYEDYLGLYAVGICYARGVGVEKSMKTAALYFKKAANKNNAEAMYTLGLLHLRGLGVPRSRPQAIKFFQDASGKGHLYAFYQLGIIASERDEERESGCLLSSRWLKAVVEHRLLSHTLSEALNAYLTGNYELALYRYLQAAYVGLEAAQYNAAFMIEQGLGLDSSTSRDQLISTLELYEHASQQNNPLATVKIGDIKFLRKDYDGAVNAYKSADNAEANFNIGAMYMTGKGMPVDYFLAKRYFDIVDGRRDGHAPAMIALAALRFCTPRRDFCNFFVDLYDFVLQRSAGLEALPPSLQVVTDTLKREIQGIKLNWVLGFFKEKWDIAILFVLIGVLQRVLLIMRQGRNRGADPPAQ